MHFVHVRLSAMTPTQRSAFCNNTPATTQKESDDGYHSFTSSRTHHFWNSQQHIHDVVLLYTIIERPRQAAGALRMRRLCRHLCLRCHPSNRPSQGANAAVWSTESRCVQWNVGAMRNGSLLLSFSHGIIDFSGKPVPSFVTILTNMVKHDGFFSIYKGVDAAIGRQLVYGTARIGLHRKFSDKLVEMNDGKPIGFAQKALSGMLSGSIVSVMRLQPILEWFTAFVV